MPIKSNVVEKATEIITPKEEKKKEQPKIQGEKPKTGNIVAVKKGVIGRKRSSMSISAMQSQKNEEKEADEIEDLSSKPKEPFTVDQLIGKWKSFSYKLKETGRQGLYITLSKRVPILNENFEIEFLIDNEIQKIELEEERVNLLTYLRTELNNYSISLNITINEVDDSVKHMSSKDKFMKMAEKNPALHELRERLNLDIEY